MIIREMRITNSRTTDRNPMNATTTRLSPLLTLSVTCLPTGRTLEVSWRVITYLPMHAVQKARNSWPSTDHVCRESRSERWHSLPVPISVRSSSSTQTRKCVLKSTTNSKDTWMPYLDCAKTELNRSCARAWWTCSRDSMRTNSTTVNSHAFTLLLQQHPMRKTVHPKPTTTLKKRTWAKQDLLVDLLEWLSARSWLCWSSSHLPENFKFFWHHFTCFRSLKSFLAKNNFSHQEITGLFANFL